MSDVAHHHEQPSHPCEVCFNQLVERLATIENAIREHHAQKADDRCIEDDDKLYAVLGLKCDRRVGSKEEMLKNCARFIDKRCEAGGWPTYAELEAKFKETVRLAEGYLPAMNKADQERWNALKGTGT